MPGITPEEISVASEEALRRHLNPNLKRNGNGVVIVWFRNDLRVIDNEALIRAWAASQFVLPVYCVDPRLFGTTHYFGFPKTGGSLNCCVKLFICFVYISMVCGYIYDNLVNLSCYTV